MDPALSELLLRSDETDEDRVVEALIRLRGPGSNVPGVRIVSRFGRVATCRLRASMVRAVRRHPDVVSLKAPRALGPEPEPPNSVAGPGDPLDLRPTDVRRPPDSFFTGDRVVVGVVDWGLDIDHPNFKRPDGTTRLLALWDQRNTAGVSPEPYGYGTVFGPDQINAALRGRRPYEVLGYRPARTDRGGGSHGTHVMDIACGNGRNGGPVGLARDADMVFVDLADRGTGGLADLGGSVRLCEGVDFIRRLAESPLCGIDPHGPPKPASPWVINLSIGRHGGPHDGTTLAEMAFDELLAAAPGRFIVQSTGNYFRAGTHASGVLRRGQRRVLRFVVDPEDVTDNELEIWYDGADEFTVRVDPPGASRGTDVPLGHRSDLVDAGDVVGRVYHRARDPNNGDNHIDAFLYPQGRAGTWTVTLEAVRARNGRFHAWLERDEACPTCQTRFVTADRDPSCSVGTIANSYLPLVVGAYDAHTPTRPVAGFSSSGPTRDDRSKPDLLAPGVDVLAARSAPPGALRSPGGLVRKSGSSMATPHVTGAVALCLQAGGQRLTAHQLRALILGSVDRGTPPTGSGHRRGRGYLDLPALLTAVRKTYLAPPGHEYKYQESSMDTDHDPIARLTEAPATAYRELLYRPAGSLAKWIGDRFEVVARPGQRTVKPARPGDVLIRVTLGYPGGECRILTDTDMSRRRILDTARCMQPGRLLLRPKPVILPHITGLSDTDAAPRGGEHDATSEHDDGDKSESPDRDTVENAVTRFPSGVTLTPVAGATAPGEEHWDPNGAGLPLYATGAEVRSRRLSANFTVGELVWSGGRHADKARISAELVHLLQKIRDRVGKPVTITSGYRSWARNVELHRARGKKPTESQHCSGRAADITIEGMTGTDIAKVAIDVHGDRIGVGIGASFAHIDVRGTSAVWTYFTGGPDTAAKAEIEKYRHHTTRLDAGPAKPSTGRCSPEHVRVAVIGGGLAGLMAAWSLQRGKFRVTVFEATTRLGGRVRSEHTLVPGKVIEAGAELIGKNHPMWNMLARTFGLTLTAITTEDEYETSGLRVRLLLDGRDIPDPEKKQLHKQLQPILERIGREARPIHPLTPWTADGAARLDSMSVSQRLSARDMFGHTSSLARRYLEFVLGNDQCAPTSRQSYLGLLTAVSAHRMGPDMLGYWTSTETHRCRDGNDLLATQLGMGLDDVRLGTPVDSLHVTRDGTRVEFRRDPAAARTEDFDYVILATPPTTWPRITSTSPFDPAKFTMAAGPAVKFLSVFDHEFWKAGKFAPSALSDRIGSVWEGTDKQTAPQKGFVLSVYSGGKQVLDSTTYATRMAELYPGYANHVTRQLLVDWPAEQWTRTGYSIPAPGQVTTIAKNLSRPFCERLFFAGEQASPGYYGYMEGALQSGLHAAGLVAVAAMAAPCPNKRPVPPTTRPPRTRPLMQSAR